MKDIILLFLIFLVSCFKWDILSIVLILLNAGSGIKFNLLLLIIVLNDLLEEEVEGIGLFNWFNRKP